MAGIGDESPALSTAFSLAKTVGAHVEALFMALDPRLEMAAGDYISPSVIDEIMKDTEKENEKRRRRSKVLFDRLTHDYAARTDIRPDASALSAAYVEASGTAHSLMADHGRLCDLIVMEQPGKRGSQTTLAIGAALRDSGRPVLITRRAMPAGFAKSVAIAWNGSLEATRTIGFAMPLLEQADKVVVFTVEGDTRYGPSAARLIEYLAWHEVSAAAVSLPPASHRQGEALLDGAKKHEVDLMMLGAYTRGELRRLIFGGVTGSMLAKCPLPLLRCTEAWSIIRFATGYHRVRGDRTKIAVEAHMRHPASH
jgi:nucleotide-binding universal stress UspA family protein